MYNMQALPGCLQLDTALALKKDSLCNSYTVTRPYSERLGLIRVYQQKHNHRSVYRPQILFRLLTDAEAIKYKLENSTSKLCPLPISYNQYYLSKGFISDPFYLFLKHQIHSDFFFVQWWAHRYWQQKWNSICYFLWGYGQVTEPPFHHP